MTKLDRTINYLGLGLALVALILAFVPPKCGETEASAPPAASP